MFKTAKMDGALVEASLEGDREAFGAIVDRYKALVSSIVYSATGDLETTQDLAQEVFIEAWRGLPGLREPAKLGPWLAGITRNLVNGLHRRRSVNPAANGGTVELVEESIASEQEGPREQAISREEKQLLWRALREIPDAYREPLVLYYWEGMNGEAVARALGIGEGAVRVRLHRGRAMLKEQVRKEVEDNLGRIKPGRALTVAVLAALPVGHAGSAAAATGAGVSATTLLSAAKPAAATFGGFLLWPLLLFHGAMANIANTRSPRERRFVLWVTCLCVGLAGAGLAGMGILARRLETREGSSFSAAWWMGLAAGTFVVTLATLVAFAVWRQRRIRTEDDVPVAGDRATQPSCEGARGVLRVNAACASTVIGGLAWLIAWSCQGAHWGWLAATLAVATVLWAWAAARSVRNPDLLGRSLRVAVVVMACFALLALNLGLARAMPWLSPDLTESIGTPAWAARVPLNVILGGFYAIVFQQIAWVFRRGAARRG